MGDCVESMEEMEEEMDVIAGLTESKISVLKNRYLCCIEL